MKHHPLSPITASELALGAQNRGQAAAGKMLEDGLGGLAPASELALGAQDRGQAAAGKRLEDGLGGLAPASELALGAQNRGQAAAGRQLEGGPKVGSVLEAPASRCPPASRPAPRLPTIPSQLRRCRNWDYKGRGIYMITLTLRDRSRPLLGRLVIDCDGSGNPEAVRAHVEPSALGAAIAAHWGRMAEFTPQIKPLVCQLMPEHFHGILFVREPMPRPLGQAIAGFKAGCTKIFREYCGPDAGPLWSEGFNDSILFAKGQLDRMFDYLADNPRRSAVKRLFPELMHVRREIRLPGVDTPVQAIGNADLLRRPSILQVQCSRRISPEELAEKKATLLAAARHGAVLVSPCISPGEKEIAKAAFDEGLPLITLLENGFPLLYKPSGKRFDACAAGRLLLVAPWPYHNEQRPITREQCLALNRLAAAMAGGLAPISELALGAQDRGVP